LRKLLVALLLAFAFSMVVANEYVHSHTRYDITQEPDFAEVGY